MSIIANCKRCGKEIEGQAALAFSPPFPDGRPDKHHICQACWVLLEEWIKNLSDHDWKTCQLQDCDECLSLIESGLIMSCDECAIVGFIEGPEWTLLNSGRTLCHSCSSKQGMLCDVSGCANHPVEEGLQGCLYCDRCMATHVEGETRRYPITSVTWRDGEVFLTLRPYQEKPAVSLGVGMRKDQAILMAAALGVDFHEE